MMADVCVCLVCGLLATGVFVFLGYHYLLASSSSEEKVEYHQRTDIHYEAVRSAKKPLSSVPASVMSKVDDVSVLKKTATFTVEGHVRLAPSHHYHQYVLISYIENIHVKQLYTHV